MKLLHCYKSLWFWVVLMHLILVAAWYTIINIANS